MPNTMTDLSRNALTVQPNRPLNAEAILSGSYPEFDFSYYDGAETARLLGGTAAYQAQVGHYTERGLLFEVAIDLSRQLTHRLPTWYIDGLVADIPPPSDTARERYLREYAVEQAGRVVETARACDDLLLLHSKDLPQVAGEGILKKAHLESVYQLGPGTSRRFPKLPESHLHYVRLSDVAKRVRYRHVAFEADALGGMKRELLSRELPCPELAAAAPTYGVLNISKQTCNRLADEGMLLALQIFDESREDGRASYRFSADYTAALAAHFREIGASSGRLARRFARQEEARALVTEVVRAYYRKLINSMQITPGGVPYITNTQARELTGQSRETCWRRFGGSAPGVPRGAVLVAELEEKAAWKHDLLSGALLFQIKQEVRAEQKAVAS